MVGTGMAMVLWVRLLADYPAGRVSAFMFLTPVFGVFLGAVILGLIESYAALWTTATHAEAVAYVTLILMLLVRPSGLLGEEE